MAFTDADRGMLVETNTTVNLLKDEYDRRLKDLEDEDKLLHARISGISKVFTGIFIAANSAWGAALGIMKFRS